MGDRPAGAVQAPPPVPVQAPPARARLRWHSAVQQIARVLRLRRRWAALGWYLQGQRIQDLVFGLERRQGRLIRRRPAP